MLGWLVAEGPQRRRGEELKQEGGGVQVKTRRGTLCCAPRESETRSMAGNGRETWRRNLSGTLCLGCCSARVQQGCNGRAGQGRGHVSCYRVLAPLLCGMEETRRQAELAQRCDTM